MIDPVLLTLPFQGRWAVQNSPLRRVPSHGVDLFGQRYAIDFVGVDESGRSAPRGWRAKATDEFVGFGRPIRAPIDGVIRAVRNGEPDHRARRSQLALLAYAVGQPARIRAGVAAVAGNHVVIEAGRGVFVALVHLRNGSLRVREGQRVRVGDDVGECGNSGNSTEPHVHVQAMDSAEIGRAKGLPIVFRDFREWRGGRVIDHRLGLPANGSVVVAL